MLTRDQLLTLATIIREETAQGLNTAQRVGHLLYEIASSFLLKSQDDHTSMRLSADELEAVERLIVAGTQLVGQNNSALYNIVSQIHGSQLIEGSQTVSDVQTNEGSTYFGPEFVSGLMGKGGFIGPDGAAELKSLVLREFLEAPELRLNRTTSVAGHLIQSRCNGIIEDVVPMTDSTGILHLKLEDGEAGTCAVGDICIGMYHYGIGDADEDYDDLKGNVRMAGFTTTYFRVESVQGLRGKIVHYSLRPQVDPETYEVLGYYPHPLQFMKFAGYGNFTNAARQASIILAHSYIRLLREVDDWEFHFYNIGMQIGELDGLHEAFGDEGCPEMVGYSAYLRNIYFTGKIEQLDDEVIDGIRDRLKNYNVNFSEHVDVITVDDVGNVIGGLWRTDTVTDPMTGQQTSYTTYRIHSAITVRNGNNVLTIAAPGEVAGEGEYQLYLQPHGCAAFLEDSTLYISAIDHIKDGVAGSSDDVNFDYDLMRLMESCSVDVVVDCEGFGTITKEFPIAIKHNAQPFIGADITNEFSAVSWNTRTSQYIGLPIVFDMKMWHNNTPLDIESVNDVSVTPEIQGMTIQKSIVTNAAGAKVAHFSITALPESLPLVTDLNVTASAVYSGVRYERTLVHTINKSTDANVYQLHPSVGEVSITYDDTKQRVISTDKVFCSVRCDSSDDKHYTVPVSDYGRHGLFITYHTYSLDSNNNEVESAEAAYNNTNGVAVSTDFTRIRFRLYKLADITLNGLSNLLDPSNVYVVLDVEDVPVILDGLDGDNNIAVHLDNSNDAVLCVEDGTVIASTLPTANARLMDGEDTVGRDVLGTTLAQNKQTLGNWSLVCHDCTAEFVGWTTINSNDWVNIRVTGVTDDVASVEIKCRYTKHGVTGNYVAILSVKKLYGLDKYEIITEPVSITYDSNTDSHSPSSVSVYIYETTQAVDRHLMTSLPGNPSSPTDGTMRLQYSVNNGANWTTLTGYSSGKSIASSLYSALTSGSLLLRIQKYVVGDNGSEWVLLDEEGVEITRNGLDGKGVEYIFFADPDWNSWDRTDATKPTINDVASQRQVDDYCPYTNDGQYQWTDEPVDVSASIKFEFYAQRKKVNGVWQPFGDVNLWNEHIVDGTSPYMIDLSNEQSFINCDSAGNVLSGSSYETSDIMLFHGTNYAFTDFNITITPTNIKCNGNSSAFTLSAQQKSTAQSNGYFRLTPSDISANSAAIAVRAVLATNSSIVLTAVYKINKNSNGAAAELYSLQPSLNVVHMDGTSNFIDTSLAVQVKKTVGATTSTLSSASDYSNNGLTLKYSQGTSSTKNDFPNVTGSSTATLFGNASYITLFLYKGNTIVDKERINIVGDGRSSVQYIVDPSPTTVKFQSSGDGAAYTPANVEVICGYKKIDGDDIYVYSGRTIANLDHISDENYTIVFRWQKADGTYTSWVVLNSYPTGSSTGIVVVPNTTSYIGIEFAMTSAIANSQSISDSNIVSRYLVPILKVSDGDTGDPGQQGLTGCRERVYEVYTPNMTYYNQEAATSPAVRYVDFMVREDNILTSGYRVYKCVDTHTSASTFRTDLANGHWEEVDLNLGSAYFKYLIAKNATIKLLSSTQFTVVEQGVPIAGFANTQVPLWVGNQTPEQAPFYVTRAGKLYATGAEISGTVKAKLFYSPTKELIDTDFTNNAYTINPASSPAHTFILDHPFTSPNGADLTINLPNATTYDGLELQFLLIMRTRSLMDSAKLSGALTWGDAFFGDSSSAHLPINELVTMKAMAGRWYCIQGTLSS